MSLKGWLVKLAIDLYTMKHHSVFKKEQTIEIHNGLDGLQGKYAE